MSLDLEAYEDIPRTNCRRCHERSVSLDESGHCYDGCEAEPVDPKRQREAIRRAYQAAAEYLTREGHPEEAERLFGKIGVRAAEVAGVR